MAENPHGYRWNGAYGQPGSSGLNGRSTKTHGNKGVRAARKAAKRAQAEARNALTAPDRRRKAARAAGLSRHSDVIPGGSR